MYTLWSRGRLLGESALSYRRAFPLLAVGDFEASPVGERLMPVILSVGPTLTALLEVVAEIKRAEGPVGPQVSPEEEWPEAVRGRTEYADAMSAQDELDSLRLELRDEDGVVVPTDWIHLKDAHRLAALGRQAFAEDLGYIPEDLEPEPWEPEPPRYQIMVALAGHDRYMEKLADGRRPNDQA